MKGADLGRNSGPTLAEPLVKKSFELCDHQLNTSSLHHWEMPLLGRSDLEEGTSCGFQPLLWLAMGTVRESLQQAQQWLQKEGLLGQVSGKGNPALRGNHIPQERDWTSSLNKSLSELTKAFQNFTPFHQFEISALVLEEVESKAITSGDASYTGSWVEKDSLVKPVLNWDLGWRCKTPSPFFLSEDPFPLFLSFYISG